MAERACIMVWDGLRPDRVSREITPNLWHLGEAGVWFERSHAVYPTLTRANSPAISTGCRPGRAGVPGNSFCLPSTGSLATYSSGDAANLQRLADADGRPILLVDTLADRVHRAGGTTVVVGSGSPGSAFLQHPRAAECGDLVFSDGQPGMVEFKAALRARFGAPPPKRLPATEWNAYFTRIITEFIVPELSPTLLVFWHTDPDHASHHCGHSAPETEQALRDADANLGALLDAYDRLGLRSTTDVIVTSDHGSSSLTRYVQPARDIAARMSTGVTVENGGSAFVYSSDVELAVAAIRQLDYAGPVFTRTGSDQTMPLSLVGLDGPRAPEVVFSLAWDAGHVGGVAGSAVGTHTRTKLLVDHGTLSPHDLRNTLVAQGPDFRVGWRNPAPVGNIDIAPTLTRLLALDAGTPFEGRVLAEALRDGAPEAPAVQSTDATVAFAARGREWVQRVWFESVGATTYVAGGAVERV
ncbi:MAG TPA: alkaline phosphatase family protein [Chloroflexota bacterium]|nr:alkaline phosphatase family protein [Chloroflexota bacterium]